MLIRNQVDGVIAVTFNRGILDYHKQNLPIVAIDHYLSNHIPVVGSDNYAGGKRRQNYCSKKGASTLFILMGRSSLKHLQILGEKHMKMS